MASYEGKAKRVVDRGDGMVDIHFKDDATAFNGKKHAVFKGKGALNSVISEIFFRELAARGIATHFSSRVDEITLRCSAVRIIPLEVVVRFRVAGSLAKRTGLAVATPCDPPVVEFYYKRDDLGDPLVTEDHIRLLRAATPTELAQLRSDGLRAALAVREICASVDLELIDLKFEYGVTRDGRLILADEISPDTCRLHDHATGRVLDKDVFREDLGDLVAAYEEVRTRLERSTAAGAAQKGSA